jgi:hypothetical protein
MTRVDANDNDLFYAKKIFQPAETSRGEIPTGPYA